jgi:hypothetical protein
LRGRCPQIQDVKLGVIEFLRLTVTLRPTTRKKAKPRTPQQADELGDTTTSVPVCALLIVLGLAR